MLTADELRRVLLPDPNDERDLDAKWLKQKLCEAMEAIEHKDGCLRKASLIIETGDNRLLAADGPAGNQPPSLFPSWLAVK